MGQAIVFLLLAGCAVAYLKLTAGNRSGLRPRMALGPLPSLPPQTLIEPTGATPIVGSDNTVSRLPAPQVDEFTVRRVAVTAPHAGGFRFVADDGTSFDVVGRTFVGRNPTGEDGEAAVVQITDDSMSISKTHALIDIVNGECWIEDRDSTNGTRVVDVTGAVEAVGAGQWARLQVGSVLQLGERAFTVVDQHAHG